MPTYNLDKKTYAGNAPSAEQIDLYTFEYPWDSIIEETFVSKTKITYADNNYTERLEAEHYCVFQASNNTPVTIAINPTGSQVFNFGDYAEFNLLTDPTNYYPQLQYPDNTNIYNYFVLFIVCDEDPLDSGILTIRYSILTPNLSGKIIVETELRYGLQ